MNRPIFRRTAAVVGAGALAYWVYLGNVMPSKNQTVIWGINRQLNEMNADADREANVLRQREKIYGKDASGDELKKEEGGHDCH